MNALERFKKKFIGDREFYRYTLIIVLPMILQNLITNFVSMLDNIMVGQVGTAEMSGVSIVNQFMFVFNITIFGGISGAGIFGTQFFGKGDGEGQKYTVRYRLILATMLIALGAVIFHFYDDELIKLFLAEDDDPAIIAETLKHGKDYLAIMLIGLIPFAYGQVYASVVRECGETKIPMLGSIAAIGVNLILDYGLILGKLGMPNMGVKGAAIATVIAKFIEALVVIVWAHAHPSKNPYIKGLYRSFRIPWNLVKTITIKGTPLLFNEFLWSLGMSVIAFSYSVRGLDVVAARNIAGTLTNLFNVVFVQMGAAIGIIVGNKLGAGKLEEARDYDNKLIAFGVIASAALIVLMVPLGLVFPYIYNTTLAIKKLATYIVVSTAFALPIWAYTNACYFTLRSGGRTGITFLFDFIFSWCIMIPLAYFLAKYSSISFEWLVIIVTYSEILKCIAGHYMIKSDSWMKNLVS